MTVTLVIDVMIFVLTKLIGIPYQFPFHRVVEKATLIFQGCRCFQLYYTLSFTSCVFCA